jgi:undecaprenyl-diphosphatase
LGYWLDDFIEAHLLGLWPITIAWLVGGFAILVVDRWVVDPAADLRGEKRTLEQMSWQTALGIGLVQTIAMCPGTSRSLATIVGGLLFGLSLGAAVEFSFLLGVITLLAATVFKAVQSGDSLAREYDWWTLLIGGVAAWLSAVLAVRWMLRFLTKHRLAVFGYYRIVLAVLVGLGLYFGWINE